MPECDDCYMLAVRETEVGAYSYKEQKLGHKQAYIYMAFLEACLIIIRSQGYSCTAIWDRWVPESDRTSMEILGDVGTTRHWRVLVAGVNEA